MHNELTMAYFRESLPKLSGPTAEAVKRYAANPEDAQAIATLSRRPELRRSLLRTTCVSTMIEGGHATNALPQKAVANINCRIFPGTPAADVQKTLTEVAADPEVKITLPGSGSVASGCVLSQAEDVMAAVTNGGARQLPGLSIVPSMSGRCHRQHAFPRATGAELRRVGPVHEGLG